MVDFDRLIIRFRQFGGWRLVWQYVRMGVLWTGVGALVRCAMKGRSLKAAYPVMTEKVDGILIRKYRHILDEMKVRHVENLTPNDGGVPKIVWFSWLQGIDQAPDLVKVCLASQRKHLPDYEFRVFDLSNYWQWVELPEYIVRKYKKGLIPAATFCDLLRLSVLQKYGGIWMDATVFCSGFGNEKLQGRWDRIMRSELTVFRYFKRGAIAPMGLSNWFIAAVSSSDCDFFCLGYASCLLEGL